MDYTKSKSSPPKQRRDTINKYRGVFKKKASRSPQGSLEGGKHADNC